MRAHPRVLDARARKGPKVKLCSKLPPGYSPLFTQPGAQGVTAVLHGLTTLSPTQVSDFFFLHSLIPPSFPSYHILAHCLLFIFARVWPPCKFCLSSVNYSRSCQAAEDTGSGLGHLHKRA